MGKPTNIGSTSHAQAAEFAALAGAADTTALKNALAKQTELTVALEATQAELAAEKEAHAATSAALEAATATKTE